jgi:hypothetical protein
MSTSCLARLVACTLVCAACGRAVERTDLGPSTPVAPAPPPAQLALAPFDEPMDERLTMEYRSCRIDADCVLAVNGCCDCANGGRDIAVSRAKLDDFKARFRCAAGCTERGGSCGTGTVTCEGAVCMYRDPR